MLTASQVETTVHGLVSFYSSVRTPFAVSLGLPHSKNSHSKSNHSGRMDKEKTDWKIEKERLLSLNLEERRKEYRRQEYTTLGEVSTWRQECKENAKVEESEPTGGGSSTSDKVSLHKGDITVLEVDAIVNAANSSLLGGGGVDGCIHKAAGGCLYDECHSLNGCETGKAKITCGYDLPAKYVIHTVGPMARGRAGPSESSDLSACYQNSLKLLVDHNLTTVAFPCISTGIFGFPNKSAADIALKTVKSWIEENPDKITRVIFCVFLDTDYDIYREKMAELFQENDMEVTEGQSKAGNTPPSKKSKNREPSEDRSSDAVPDIDVHMESQNQDEMGDDEKQDEEAAEEDEDDDDGAADGEDANPKEKAEEEMPAAARPMDGGDPVKPKEETDDNAGEDGERGTSNGVDASEAEENKD